MKIIAISGGSCSGKSTLIAALEDAGYRVDGFKAARAVMSKLGLSVADLKDANEDTIKTFQTALFEAKRDHDTRLGDAMNMDLELKYKADDIIFVERSLADLMGFATLWHTKTKSYANWLLDYRNGIDMEQDLIYNKVFLLPAGKFEYQADGVRVDASVQDFLDRIITMQTLECTHNVHLVDAVSVEDRVAEIESFLEGIN